jgi:hypothetical protein
MGKINDIHGETSIARLLDPAAVTTTGVIGQAVDMQSYQGRVKIALLIAAVSGTTPTLDIKVQDCDTIGGTYADVSPAVAFTQKVTASANSVDAIGLDPRGCRRYVKLYATAGGTSPSFTIGAAVIGQKQTI